MVFFDKTLLLLMATLYVSTSFLGLKWELLGIRNQLENYEQFLQFIYLVMEDICWAWFGDKARVSPSLVLRIMVGCDDPSWSTCNFFSLSFSFLDSKIDDGLNHDFSSFSCNLRWVIVKYFSRRKISARKVSNLRFSIINDLLNWKRHTWKRSYESTAIKSN